MVKKRMSDNNSLSIFMNGEVKNNLIYPRLIDYDKHRMSNMVFLPLIEQNRDFNNNKLVVALIDYLMISHTFNPILKIRNEKYLNFVCKDSGFQYWFYLDSEDLLKTKPYIISEICIINYDYLYEQIKSNDSLFLKEIIDFRTDLEKKQ